MDKSNIPNPIIGLLGEIFRDEYTHAEIDRLFTYANAPGDIPEGNKVDKTVDWLRRVNKISDKPLDVLGAVLEDLMEKETISDELPWEDEPESIQRLGKYRRRINDSLAKFQLQYTTGGFVAPKTSMATESLKDKVEQGGIGSINVEIDRALAVVETDPNGAVHFAGNVLEATMKFYLERRLVPFNDEADGIPVLWQKVRDDIGINPKDLDSNDLKLIASGLGKIIEGTMKIRNKKSGAHGRTERQTLNNQIRPRHARLVVHSSHTIAVYILECLEGR